MNKNLIFFSIVSAGLMLTGCRNNNHSSDKQQVTVSILPQKFLVDFLSDKQFEVQVLLPPGSNHEIYEPSPRDMQKISDSKAYFILGHLDFEETWLLRFSTANPAMHIVNTGDGIQNLVGHAHQHSNETYSHSVDPHIWLSTSCMKIQAQHICETLCKLDSQNKIQYLDKLLSFNILADSIDMSIKKIFRDSQQKTILIFHPALGYFARDYGLEQISIEQEGKEPSPAHLAELIKAAKSRNLSKIFISKEFDTRHAESLAKEINAKVVVFDPMAEAWPENMLQLATLIASN